MSPGNGETGSDAERLEAYERGFRRAGLPLFSEDFSAAEDVFNRAAPLLALLLRVAGGLAAFSGFYFAISMLTDTTYREEFLEELTTEMRESFRERAAYLKLRARVVT